MQLHRPWLYAFSHILIPFYPKSNNNSEFWLVIYRCNCSGTLIVKPRYQGFFLTYVVDIILQISLLPPFHPYILCFWDSSILLHGSIIISLICYRIPLHEYVVKLSHITDICIIWGFNWNTASEWFCMCLLVYLCKYKPMKLLALVKWILSTLTYSVKNMMMNASFIYSTVKLIFMKHKLCARHYSRT